MERVSSVTAFLSRFFEGGDLDADVAAVVDTTLTATERHLLELFVRLPDPEERIARLRDETGEAWSVSRLERTERLALMRLRHALAQRDLLQP